jgi:5'-methylthioadenosine phosphorylase
MIGIIGGTGLYRMEALRVTETREVTTPFGKPSSPLVLGKLAGREVAFLARHGLHHDLLPSEINFRANIWALKSVGARTVIGVSAVGSLREEIRPGDISLPSQYVDFTKGLRVATFFGRGDRSAAEGIPRSARGATRDNRSAAEGIPRSADGATRGIVAHVSTAQPVCRSTADLIARVARSLGTPVHENKTYACVEGPRLGTRAESFFLRTAGADLVGMTNVPEAFLAVEAQVGYCTISLATDYDCWLDDASQHVSAEQVIALFHKNLGRVQQLIAGAVAEYVEDESRPCRHALKTAILTPREQMTDEQKKIVDFLLI